MPTLCILYLVLEEAAISGAAVGEYELVAESHFVVIMPLSAALTKRTLASPNVEHTVLMDWDLLNFGY